MFEGLINKMRGYKSQTQGKMGEGAVGMGLYAQGHKNVKKIHRGADFTSTYKGRKVLTEAKTHKARRTALQNKTRRGNRDRYQTYRLWD